MTRRSLLGLLALPVATLKGQQPRARPGMASRGVKPLPRGKPSGLPFHARLTDIAGHAGLKQVVVCGHPNHADYVIEAMSCGAAFFDYDNDGWIDILVLSGSRFDDPPPTASNRLYKNNRDGTFTDVTAKAGLFRTGYAYGVTVGDYNNDGFEDLFITCWGQNALYRNNRDGTFTASGPDARSWTMIAMASSTYLWPIMPDSTWRLCHVLASRKVAMSKVYSAGRAAFLTDAIRSITTTAMEHLPT